MLRRKPILLGYRPLLAIGYKYNSPKALSFVATSGARSTTLGIHYLSKYPDQFSNVSIIPVARPLLMSKCFGLVNEADSHNRSGKWDLALEKF